MTVPMCSKCGAVPQLVGGWPPRVAPEARDAWHAHIENCPSSNEAKRGWEDYNQKLNDECLSVGAAERGMTLPEYKEWLRELP